MKIDREKTLELADIKGQNLLDIGAGDLAIIAAERFGCTVTSIDVSKDIIRRERKRVEKKGLGNRITIEEQDATELPYQDNSFDAVISYGALHHNDPDMREKFIEEAIRVAKNKVVFADFKPQHHIHPEDVHPPVDHEELQRVLTQFGDIETYEGEEKLLHLLEIIP